MKYILLLLALSTNGEVIKTSVVSVHHSQESCVTEAKRLMRYPGIIYVCMAQEAGSG